MSNTVKSKVQPNIERKSQFIMVCSYFFNNVEVIGCCFQDVSLVSFSFKGSEGFVLSVNVIETSWTVAAIFINKMFIKRCCCSADFSSACLVVPSFMKTSYIA